uniref:glycosyltransferase family protein n=1 Tax=Aquabacterium sp. TaxID=1872578 RepID=UPI0035B2F198
MTVEQASTRQLRALYVGDSNPASTSCHRAQALRRIGCHVDILDPYQALRWMTSGVLGAVNYRTGYTLSRRHVVQWLRSTLLAGQRYDLCWVDSGELLSAAAIRFLKTRSNKVVLFNHDDPSGPRDYIRFLTLRRAIPEYDLCVVVRPFNVAEFKALGAKDVIHLWRRYDEVAHKAPLGDAGDIPEQYKVDVAFVGYCIRGEGRDYFLLDLIRKGLKPAIWGDNWHHSTVWPLLKPYWRGGSLSGVDYVNAIRGAKVCLGLLSKRNRDEHTTRTLEIPYAGGLLCAERTAEHVSLFREGEEAVFWSSSEECAEQIKRLLNDEALRTRIKEAGQKRVIEAGMGNENLCREVIQRLGAAGQGLKVMDQSGLAMKNKVYFFDSHPVQYKAPVYQELQKAVPDSFEVIYASDFSVRGGSVDKEFGAEVKWDTPLMTGYAFRVLGNERGIPLSNPGSLTARGIFTLLRKERPKAVVLTHSRYAFDRAAYLSALALGIPILIRQETQDEMFADGRSGLKKLARYLAYRLMYAPVRHAFSFGVLNYEHLAKHGISPQNISTAHFSVPDPIASLSLAERAKRRDDMRLALGVPAGHKVVAFFGKFIPKKNPELLFEALGHMPHAVRSQLFLLFVGAGELQADLDKLAAAAAQKWGIQTHFAGFINQTKLPDYYL